MFPLKCSIKEMDQFIDGSKPITQGWISFYWGQTIEEYAKMPSPTISDLVTKEWLEYFKAKRVVSRHVYFLLKRGRDALAPRRLYSSLALEHRKIAGIIRADILLQMPLYPEFPDPCPI